MVSTIDVGELKRLLLHPDPASPPLQILHSAPKCRGILSSIAVGLRGDTLHFSNWRVRTEGSARISEWLLPCVKERTMLILDETGECARNSESDEKRMAEILTRETEGRVRVVFLNGGRAELVAAFPLLDPTNLERQLCVSPETKLILYPPALHEHFGSVIEGRLFLGEKRAREEKNIGAMGVLAVMNCAANSGHEFSAVGSGVRQLNLTLSDSDEISDEILTAGANFIDENISDENPVLVHCISGVNRSVTMTAAYLMTRRGICLSEAFSICCKARPFLNPWIQNLQWLLKLDQKMGHHSCALLDLDPLLVREKNTAKIILSAI